MSNLRKILVDKKNCKSLWFMRQAGRYLPEFRKIRSQNTNFIDLCLNSDLSSEITLQPIKRYNIDSAIIFSDILLVPFAMGQEVEFIKDKGPVLSAFSSKVFFKIKKNIFLNRLSPIYKSINKTRINLDKHKSLIGFVGAPWTLLIYMLGLKKENNINFSRVDNKNLNIDRILDKLIEYLCLHIEHQINAGADVIQIFDSWASICASEEYEAASLKWIRSIVQGLKKPVPVILYAKGMNECLPLQLSTGAKVLSVDWTVDIDKASELTNNQCALQGNLDPLVLTTNPDNVIIKAQSILKKSESLKGYIFNLGHGMVPQAKIECVEALIDTVNTYTYG